MSAESGLIIGCGPKGLGWASGQEAGKYLCLDSDPNLPDSELLCRSNIFSVDPAEFGHFSQIHADLFLNAVFPPEVNFADVIENPDILGDFPFPHTVVSWYRQAGGVRGSVLDHLPHIRWMIREAAFQQMWGLLAVEGIMTIVDTDEVIDWLHAKGREILGVGPNEIEINRVEITVDDRERSASQRLERINNFPGKVKKIEILKH